MERYKVFGLTAKSETTSGTDSTPTVADNAVRTVGIPTLKVDYLEGGDRDDVQTGTLMGADRSAPAGRWGTVEVTVEVKGGGAAYNGTTIVPECDVFLRMAGCTRAVVTTGGSESIRYTTLDAVMETGTVWCYTGGKLIKLVGCVATLKGTLEAKKRGLLTFGITGRVATDPADLSLPTLTYSSVLPPPFLGAAVTIGSWSSADVTNPLVPRKVELDFGNVVGERPSAGATDGIVGYIITDRKVQQTMEIEVPPASVFDAYALSKATTSGLPSSSTYQVGTAQYNRMKVATGRWEVKAPTGPTDGNGIAVFSINGKLLAGAPTTLRELNITFD